MVNLVITELNYHSNYNDFCVKLLILWFLLIVSVSYYSKQFIRSDDLRVF